MVYKNSTGYPELLFVIQKLIGFKHKSPGIQINHESDGGGRSIKEN